MLLKGQSLWKILEGAAEGSISGLAYAGADKSDPRLFSVEDGRHKLIWAYPNGPRMLFDLTRDPMEQQNIAPTEARVTKRLSRVLAEQVSKLRSVETLLEASSDLDEEEVKRLRSLGYVE